MESSSWLLTKLDRLEFGIDILTFFAITASLLTYIITNARSEKAQIRSELKATVVSRLLEGVSSLATIMDGNMASSLRQTKTSNCLRLSEGKQFSIDSLAPMLEMFTSVDSIQRRDKRISFGSTIDESVRIPLAEFGAYALNFENIARAERFQVLPLLSSIEDLAGDGRLDVYREGLEGINTQSIELAKRFSSAFDISHAIQMCYWSDYYASQPHLLKINRDQTPIPEFGDPNAKTSISDTLSKFEGPDLLFQLVGLSTKCRIEILELILNTDHTILDLFPDFESLFYIDDERGEGFEVGALVQRTNSAELYAEMQEIVKKIKDLHSSDDVSEFEVFGYSSNLVQINKNDISAMCRFWYSLLAAPDFIIQQIYLKSCEEANHAVKCCHDFLVRYTAIVRSITMKEAKSPWWMIGSSTPSTARDVYNDIISEDKLLKFDPSVYNYTEEPNYSE